MILGAAVFLVTYLLIAGKRLQFLPLDKPGGALFGAVLAVILGVLTPQQAIAAINGETLLLLFGLMGVGAFLAEGGLLERAGDALAARARTPARLMGLLIWGAGALAALVTNDAVCVIGAPLVVGWIEKHRLPPLPFLLALATSANTGSVATLVGNPQNMLCASLGQLDYRAYVTHLLPVAVAGLAINHALLAWQFRRQLAGASLRADLPPPAPVLDRPALMTLVVLAGTVTAYLLGADLAFTAVAGFTALLVVHRSEGTALWGRIDWSVLLFFGGLFVVVEALVRSGAAGWALAQVPLFSPGATSGLSGLLVQIRTASIFLVGSNVVSNVPFILVIAPDIHRAAPPNPTLVWELLAMASTFAGNLTLLGSVANIIVAERGRAHGGLPFWAHLRVGLPLALVTTLLGTGWLVLVHAS